MIMIIIFSVLNLIVVQANGLYNLVDNLVDDGIPKDKLSVGIIGAGVGGLYAALLLNDIGLDYEILEGSRWSGGRLFTHHFHSWGNYNYFDVGAMRFPNSSVFKRLLGPEEYSLINYLNQKANDHSRVVMKPYIFKNNNTFYYFNGVKLYNNESLEGDKLHFGVKNGGNVPDEYAEKGYSYWINVAFEHFRERLYHNFTDGFDHILTHDDKSTRSFLSTFNDSSLPGLTPYPQTVIDWLETMDSATGHYDAALTETVVQSNFYNNPYINDWYLIDGGVTKLVKSMVSQLNPSRILHNHRVLSIGRKDPNFITLRTSNSGRRYNHVINTGTLGALRVIDLTNCNVSVAKNTAIRVLSYDKSVKVAMKFVTRWWQNSDRMNGRPIVGGQTYTDLPIRLVVYPSYGIEHSSPGILIVSYTQGRDAEIMGALTDSEIEALCLKNLEEIHGKIVNLEYTGQYYVYRWLNDERTVGAYSLFSPGQFSTHYDELIRPEVDGRLHFAGETASRRHPWVVGALEASYRSVREILEKEGLTKKLDLLIQRWGSFDDDSFRP